MAQAQARTAIVAAAAKAGATANREMVVEQGVRVGGGDGARGVGQGPGETRIDYQAVAVEINAAGQVSFCTDVDDGADKAKVTAKCAQATKRKFVPLDTTVDSRTTRKAVMYSVGYTRPAQ